MSRPWLSHHLQADGVHAQHRLMHCLPPDRSSLSTNRIDATHTRSLPLIGNWRVKPSSWAASL